jgi:hypothetical protein
MKKNHSPYFALVALFLASCSHQAAEHRDAVTTWIGRTLVIPQDQIAYTIATQPINCNLGHFDYKIISYIDSAGCVPCRMKLSEWKDLLDEFNASSTCNVGFTMILNTSDVDKIAQNIRHTFFMHPIVFDESNTFFKANNLPQQDDYHTFLLDDNNCILAIGNPAVNPKIRTLYKGIIFDNQDNPSDNSNIRLTNLCPHPVHALGHVNVGDTISATFALTNTDNTPYTLQALVPSCDCTFANADSDSLVPGGTMNITVTYVGDSISEPFKRHVDVYFHELQSPQRLIVYGVTN